MFNPSGTYIFILPFAPSRVNVFDCNVVIVPLLAVKLLVTFKLVNVAFAELKPFVTKFVNEPVTALTVPLDNIFPDTSRACVGFGTPIPKKLVELS